MQHLLLSLWFGPYAFISRSVEVLAARRRTAAATGQVALLFKAKAPRFKDQRDFDRVLPHLDRAARSWLASALEQAHPGHAWHERLRGRRQIGG